MSFLSYGLGQHQAVVYSPREVQNLAGQVTTSPITLTGLLEQFGVEVPMSLISLIAGNTINLSVTVYDEAGAVVDLTGITGAEFTAKVLTADKRAVLRRQLGEGIIVAAPATGVVAIEIAPEHTISLEGTYEYELVVTIPTGRYRVLRGKLALSGAVQKTL